MVLSATASNSRLGGLSEPGGASNQEMLYFVVRMAKVEAQVQCPPSASGWGARGC